MSETSPMVAADLRSAVVEILDCTLRDGSYAVDFQFTETTIRRALSGLEQSGVRFIELGHGLGLNAAVRTPHPTRISDARCFRLACEELASASWGMFCIPGIAELDHLRQAVAAGMRFVRVGVDITAVAPAEAFLALAKDLGITAFANLMKTNVLGVDGVTDAVRQCAEYGADAVYLVDSAGGYLPSEVAELFATVAGSVAIPLGFHGHDNLSLANANALAAAGGGAQFVDTTLDGIGRGAGNTVTETFAAALHAKGNRNTYDFRALGELSESVIRPLPRLHDDRTYQLVGGVTRTHSSFFPMIRRCAQIANVDAVELMAAVADIDRVHPTEDVVLAAAIALAAPWSSPLPTALTMPTPDRTGVSMTPTDPVILLVDPADSRNGREYRTAINDLGFRVVPLFTGLLSAPPAGREGEQSLHVGDVDDAIRQIRAAGFDLRAVVPALGASVHLADEIAARLGLPGNDHTLGHARRNKAAMRARAAATGIRVPEFRWVKFIGEIAEAAKDIGFPVIVKQTMGSGSFGVRVVGDTAALDEAITSLVTDRFHQPITEWLVERYVRGREYAVNFYSADGAHRLVDIWEYRQPDDRDYDFPLWDIVQIDTRHPDHARVERFVTRVLDAFGIRRGPSHIEVKCGDDGEVYLIELAARFSGGPAVQMWSRHSDLRPFHDAVECYLGRRPRMIDGEHGFRAVLGSVVIRNDDAPGTLVAVHGVDELAALPGVADVLVEFRPGDHVPITNHNMCIPVSASVHAPDRATVLHTLALARTAVHLEITPTHTLSELTRREVGAAPAQ